MGPCVLCLTANPVDHVMCLEKPLVSLRESTPFQNGLSMWDLELPSTCWLMGVACEPATSATGRQLFSCVPTSQHP